MLNSKNGGLRGLLALTLGMAAQPAQAFAGLDLPSSSAKRATARFKPHVDRVGMPHGHSGDKLIRKAMKGTVGLRGSRGPFAGWHMSTLKAAKPRKG